MSPATRTVEFATEPLTASFLSAARPAVQPVIEFAVTLVSSPPAVHVPPSIEPALNVPSALVERSVANEPVTVIDLIDWADTTPEVLEFSAIDLASPVMVR